MSTSSQPIQQPQGVILISINDSTAYQNFDNQRVPISKGVLDLSLISVNSDIDFYNPTEMLNSERNAGTDYWLVLSIRNEKAQSPFELALPSSVPIDRIENKSYSIPSPTLPEATIEIALPEDINNEDLESFEVLLSSYAALPMDKSQQDLRGKLCLVDPTDGHVMGTLDTPAETQEDSSLTEKGNEKQPVFVDMKDETVRISAAKDPSFLIRSSQYVSQAVIGGGNLIGKGLAMASSSFVAHTKPGEKPLVFSEKTQNNARRVHNVTFKAAHVSGKTVGTIADSARSLGARVTGKNKPNDKSKGDSKPGLLNKAFISVDNVLNSFEKAGKTLIQDTTMAASVAGAHKYGPEFGQAIRGSGEAVSNAAIVYIDVRGISRRALIKSAGKGMVLGNMKDGRQVQLPNPNQTPSPSSSSKSPSPKAPSKN